MIDYIRYSMRHDVWDNGNGVMNGRRDFNTAYVGRAGGSTRKYNIAKTREAWDYKPSRAPSEIIMDTHEFDEDWTDD